MKHESIIWDEAADAIERWCDTNGHPAAEAVYPSEPDIFYQSCSCSRINVETYFYRADVRV